MTVMVCVLHVHHNAMQLHAYLCKKHIRLPLPKQDIHGSSSAHHLHRQVSTQPYPVRWLPIHQIRVLLKRDYSSNVARKHRVHSSVCLAFTNHAQQLEHTHACRLQLQCTPRLQLLMAQHHVLGKFSVLSVVYGERRRTLRPCILLLS